VDFRAASESLSKRGRSAVQTTHRTLGLLADYNGRAVPTNGALLLFGKTRREWIPDAVIRCHLQTDVHCWTGGNEPNVALSPS
jgi:predicted HTH transcriptional regulator